MRNWFVVNDNIHTEGKQQANTAGHATSVTDDVTPYVFNVDCGLRPFY